VTTIIQGRYFDGRSSTSWQAELLVDSGDLIHLLVGEGVTAYPFDQVHISDRLGQTPRSFRFPDGGKFETQANDEVDRILAGLRIHIQQRWLYSLESRLSWEMGIFFCDRSVHLGLRGLWNAGPGSRGRPVAAT